jgi:hypothetical protein
MKEAARQVQQEITRQLVSKEKKEELRKIAAARVEEQAAKKRAAEAAAAKEVEARERELEADRQRVEQEEQREKERRREQRDEEERREQREARRRLEDDRRARKRSEDDRKARRRSEEDRETRKRSEDDRKARKRSEDFRGTEERPEAGRAEAERAEDRQEEASWEGRHVRDRRIQERLGKRKEERPGRSSGPEGAGLEPGYTIPRRNQPWKTTASPSRSLPSSYKDYAIALPRGEEERLVFQQLLDKKMLFRDPGTGPDRCKQPHFRFKAGEPILGSERADRRRSRSPEKQEAARKRHRNLKN